MKPNRRYIWSALLCIYIAVLAYICFVDADKLPLTLTMIWGIPVDKVAHFLMFLPYTLIAYGAFRPEEGGRRRQLLMIAAIFVSGIALSGGTEYLQGFTDGRFSEVEDFYADALGLSISTLLTLLCNVIQNKLHRHE